MSLPLKLRLKYVNSRVTDGQTFMVPRAEFPTSANSVQLEVAVYSHRYFLSCLKPRLLWKASNNNQLMQNNTLPRLSSFNWLKFRGLKATSLPTVTVTACSSSRGRTEKLTVIVFTAGTKEEVRHQDEVWVCCFFRDMTRQLLDRHENWCRSSWSFRRTFNNHRVKLSDLTSASALMALSSDLLFVHC